MAVSINYDMDQGSTFSISLTATNANGTPKNISSGYAVLSQMRKYYSSNTGITLTSSITGGTGGLKVGMSATDTATVKSGVYFYDIELHGLSSSPEPFTVKRLQQGMITVYPEVTKIDYDTYITQQGTPTMATQTYTNIFSICTGDTKTIANGVALPNHSALYVATSSAVDVTFENIDGTTSVVRFPSGTSIVLPVKINSYNYSGSALYLYGLV